MSEAPQVSIAPWAPGDLDLLHRLLGDAEMTAHLGGPESPEKIEERHARYLAGRPGEFAFRVSLGAAREGVGWVGYWEQAWHGEDVYEIGWSVVPEMQGRGIASAATMLALRHAAEHGDRGFVHASPNVTNGASNALCRKLGFELLGEVDVEYPPGSRMRCNDWRIALAR